MQFKCTLSGHTETEEAGVHNRPVENTNIFIFQNIALWGLKSMQISWKKFPNILLYWFLITALMLLQIFNNKSLIKKNNSVCPLKR